MKKSELGVFAVAILALSLIFIVGSSVSFVSATHNATHTNSTNQSLPNLVAVNIQTSSFIASSGPGTNSTYNITVSFNVRNTGGTTAGSTSSRVWVFESNQQVVAVPSLVSGQTSSLFSRNFLLNYPPGTYNAFVRVDYNNQVPESDENNQFSALFVLSGATNGTNSTNQTHRACVNNTCALVNGSGSNQCSTLGASCGNQTSICGNGIVESGEACDPPGSSISCTSQGVSGTKTCNAQCTSYGSCIIPYHNECREVNGTRSCVPIPGNGTAQCRNDAGCQTGPIIKSGNTGRESSAGVQYSPPSALFAKLMCFFSSKC